MLDTRNDSETFTDWAIRVIDAGCPIHEHTQANCDYCRQIGTLRRPALTQYRCQCGQNYLVEGKVIGRQVGHAITPVIAIITAFTVAAVLIAQSGLLHTICARLAEVR